jgi:hypothetical protein
MDTTLANPADAYKTWRMGVRRHLERTGYHEAAAGIARYDRDLRGVYLSGASTTEAARIVERMWGGGYLANPSGTTVAWIVGGLAVAGAVLYFVFKKPAAAAAEAATPGTAPAPAACPLDPAKLASWGIQHGYRVFPVPSGPPPAAPPVSGFGVDVSTIVAVTSDGKFWTYTVPPVGPTVATERADLRDAYCKSVGATAGLAAMFMV